MTPNFSHQVAAVVSVILLLGGNCSFAEDLAIEVINLPALRINGEPAAAHVQGLELANGKYYVTARREDVRPKRALLLRTDTTNTVWDVWEITPSDPAGIAATLDHPGGMQSDGKRLWIPLAESKRNGRSIICVFPLEGLIAGKPVKPELEFSINDHIGALAVLSDRRLVFGANWDTETVYVWDFEGHLKRTLTGSALRARGLGAVTGADGREGVAVQDWKCAGNQLFASGLFRTPGSAATIPQSRFMSFDNFLEPDFERRIAVLPLRDGTELGREAMATAGDLVSFLPADLGVSNRIFRVKLADLLKRSAAP